MYSVGYYVVISSDSEIGPFVFNFPDLKMGGEAKTFNKALKEAKRMLKEELARSIDSGERMKAPSSPRQTGINHYDSLVMIDAHYSR